MQLWFASPYIPNTQCTPVDDDSITFHPLVSRWGLLEAAKTKLQYSMIEAEAWAHRSQAFIPFLRGKALQTNLEECTQVKSQTPNKGEETDEARCWRAC